MIKKYITKQSSIKGAGKGLFTNAFFKKGEVIGLAHVNGQPTKEVGSNHNHNEKNPTANNIKNGNKRYLIASKNLKPGEEINIDVGEKYTITQLNTDEDDNATGFALHNGIAALCFTTI